MTDEYYIKIQVKLDSIQKYEAVKSCQFSFLKKAGIYIQLPLYISGYNFLAHEGQMLWVNSACEWVLIYFSI